MAVDGEGVTELITWVSATHIRFCPVHRLPFDPDSVQYRDAGRCCPRGGEALVGTLARWRELDGTPAMELPDPWDEPY